VQDHRLAGLVGLAGESLACGVSGMIAMVTGPGRARVRLSRAGSAQVVDDELR
jgi:hypothetical protein